MSTAILKTVIGAALLLGAGCGKTETVVVGPAVPIAPAQVESAAGAAPKVVLLADGVAEASFHFVDKTPCAACVRAVNKAMLPFGAGFKSHDLAPGEPAFKVRFDPRVLDARKLAAALAAAEPAIHPQG